jgi:predicted RNase H-like HicB family nuclease
MVCIAAGHDDDWEAFCLDYNLAVQGRSFEEVKRDLLIAIDMYVQAALEEPEPARSQLLSRRAPFFVRLKWAWRLFAARISSKSRRDNPSPFEFPLACHA